jgi:hypothetical protein
VKHITTFALASISVGCAAQPPVQQSSAPPANGSWGRSSSALAFDPPIARAEITPDLSRDGRGGAALVGFEEPATSSYDVLTYDSQGTDGSSYYDKQAISERIGTTHR